MEEETFSKVFEGTVIFVKEMSGDDTFRGIFVYREGDLKDPIMIVAEEGAIHSNPDEGLIKLSMRNGVVHTFGDKSSSEAAFSEYDFVLTTVIKQQKELKPNERAIRMSDIRISRPRAFNKDWKNRSSRGVLFQPYHPYSLLRIVDPGRRPCKGSKTSPCLGRLDTQHCFWNNSRTIFLIGMQGQTSL
jgi:lipopolysaccharide export LptBFGC system permease protein LptF